MHSGHLNAFAIVPTHLSHATHFLSFGNQISWLIRLTVKLNSLPKTRNAEGLVICSSCVSSIPQAAGSRQCFPLPSAQAICTDQYLANVMSSF